MRKKNKVARIAGMALLCCGLFSASARAQTTAAPDDLETALVNHGMDPVIAHMIAPVVELGMAGQSAFVLGTDKAISGLQTATANLPQDEADIKALKQQIADLQSGLAKMQTQLDALTAAASAPAPAPAPAPTPTPTFSPTITAKSAAQGTQTTIAATAGQAIWVGCDYATGTAPPTVTDSAADSFVQIAAAKAASQAASAYVAFKVAGGTTTVSCPGALETYALAISGVSAVDAAAPLNGPASPATGSIISDTAVLAIAYSASGRVTNAAPWTTQSNFDGNLVSTQITSAAGSIAASFPTTMDWTLILTALR